MKALSLKDITMAGLIAAVYAVLGLAFAPISFGVYQVRVAEALTVLPFLTRAAIPGLFIGCMLANVYGGQGWQDIIFGSMITLVAAVLTRLTARLTRRSYSYAVSSLPVSFLLVGGSLLLIMTGGKKLSVALVFLSIAFNVFSSGRTNGDKKRQLRVGPRIASGILMVAAVVAAYPLDDWLTYTMTVVALIGSWLLYWYLDLLRASGDNPNILLAPLPPVVLNAFGVSLYLAPILDFNYWFTVQMIGIGQLIACYVLGLPLLKLLQKRKGLFA